MMRKAQDQFQVWDRAVVDPLMQAHLLLRVIAIERKN